VLEVGVGTGLVGSRLARLGLEVVGVDVDPGLARRAQRRLRGRIVLGDAFALPFRDSWFAGAVAVWVLHKLAAPERALAEVARVLRPGGRLVVVHGRGGGVALSPAAGLRIESRDMMGEYPRVIFRRS
jgi:ubiquinone/menaquinone biosynthesis C-methylase UbiE